MKVNKKTTIALGMAACLGIVFSVAVQADPEKNAVDNPTVQQAAELPELPNELKLEAPPAELPEGLESEAPAELPEELKLETSVPPIDLDLQEVAVPPKLEDKGAELAEPEQAAIQQEQTTGSANPAAADMPTYAISLFSHDVHVNGMGLGCTDCHDGIFQQAGGSAKAAGDFNMAAFSQGKYCGACHDGSTAFSVKEQNSCARCHGSEMIPPTSVIFEQPVKAVVFEHSRHTEEFGLACNDCHGSLFKTELGSTEKQSDFTMEAIYKGKYCGACHDGATAFAANTRCTICHIGVKGYNRLFNGAKKEAGHGKEH